MDLFSILACPACKVNVQQQGDLLVCSQCQRSYPIVNGVPVFLAGGAIPSTEHQHELDVHSNYDPWVHRVVLQSLPSNAIILEIGAGNQALDLPNVIRMDVTLTAYVDVVGDAHMLPFMPGTFDFVFSLAVMEHLRQPFVAAQEMYNVLRNGGYVFGDCCFVFAYHSFPNHYFNASRQGLEEVFSPFEKIRSGIAPYQMPSFALDILLVSYLRNMSPSEDPGVADFHLLLREVLSQPLRMYDSLFTEENAFNLSGGVFFFGRKALPEPSDVIPEPVQAIWEEEPSIKSCFPQLFDIGAVPNILLWAKDEGRYQFSAIDEYFQNLVPFRKNASVGGAKLELFNALPVVPPTFTHIADPAPVVPLRPGELGFRQRLDKLKAENDTLEAKVVELDTYAKQLTLYIDEKEAYIERLEADAKRLESLAGETIAQRIYNRIRRIVRLQPR